MNQCIICLEETNHKCMDCVCKYYVHKQCLNQWLKQSRKCIICKTPIEPKHSLFILISAQFVRFLWFPLLFVYFGLIIGTSIIRETSCWYHYYRGR